MLALIPLLTSFSAAPPMIVHLRADTGIVRDESGRVATWKDLSKRHSDFVTPKVISTRNLPPYNPGSAQPGLAVPPNPLVPIGPAILSNEPDATFRPWIEIHSTGGRPSVEFRSGQTLVDTTSLPLDSGFTLFVVAQDSSGTNAFTGLFGKGAYDLNVALWAGIDANFQIGTGWVKNFASSTFETTAPTLYEASWDGQTGRIWANGKLLSSGTWNGTPARNKATWLGTTMNQYGELMGFLKGRVSEVRVYPGALADSDRKSVEDSLRCRYQLDSLACPTGERLIAHLRADTGLVLDNAGHVVTWKDLSPRHTDFVTPNLDKPNLLFLTPYEDIRAARRYVTLDSAALLRPSLEKNCLLGKGSCVSFHGANTLVDTTWLPLDSGFTLFIVAQDSSGKGAFTALVDKGPGDMNTDLWTGVDGNFQMGVAWVENIAQSDFETAAPTLYGSAWNGRDARIWANGRLEGSGSSDVQPTRNQNTWLGSVYNQYPVLMGFLTGRIYEVRIYSGTLPDARRKAIEDSLIKRYGLQEPKPRAPEHMLLHLRADTGIVQDGSGRVATWKDLSSRHSDFVTPQLFAGTSDTSRRPWFERNSIGHLPAIEFRGNQTLADTTSLPLDSGFTLFVVAQDSSGPGTYSALFGKGAFDLGVDLWAGVDGNFQISVGWVDDIVQSQFETNRATLYEASWDGRTGRLRADGKLLSVDTLTIKGTRNRTTWIGARTNPYQEMVGWFKGRVSEVRLYPGSLNECRRLEIQDSLLNRYQLARSTSGIKTHGASNPSARVIRSGSHFEVISSRFQRITLLTPNGRILSHQTPIEGRTILPGFQGTAILSLAGEGIQSETRILTTTR